jgi:hypothetical protein
VGSKNKFCRKKKNFSRLRQPHTTTTTIVVVATCDHGEEERERGHVVGTLATAGPTHTLYTTPHNTPPEQEGRQWSEKAQMGCDVDASWQEKKNGPKTPSSTNSSSNTCSIHHMPQQQHI